MNISQTGNGHKIELNNIENGLLYINAPGSDITITLKSLHDSSFIKCRNLKICVTDDFFQCNIISLDENKKQFESLHDEMDEILFELCLIHYKMSS